MAITGDTMLTSDQEIEARFHEATTEAARRFEQEFSTVCPTSKYLQALVRDLDVAQTNPQSVQYPELVDPEAFWDASIKPQAAALRDSGTKIFEWLEAGVVSIMEAEEANLRGRVDLAAASTGRDPGVVRESLQHEVEQRCLELHHLIAEILDVVPTREALVEARSDFEERLRSAAVVDVDNLRPAYMEAAGGDEAHQMHAQRQWSDTHSDRVAYREALLQAEAPWRHQELAIVGQERSHSAMEEMAEAVVARLQGPLGTMSRLLMERYDSMGGA